MKGQAGTPFADLPLGMSSAVYTSGHTPMIRNSCCTIAFICGLQQRSRQAERVSIGSGSGGDGQGTTKQMLQRGGSVRYCSGSSGNAAGVAASTAARHRRLGELA